MRQYAYFPGCSLEKIALSYNQSTQETAKKLGIELRELEDWNCCGATAYFHVDEILAYTLCARNIAMAEKENLDLVAPCSACYKNTYFTNKYLKEDQDMADNINVALQEDDLHFSGSISIRNLIEVFTEDVGVEEISEKVSQPLQDLRVAPYYGCQIVRPRKDGEEIEQPVFFENLISAMGAEPVDFALKTRCCGGSLLISSREAALSMIHKLLKNAEDSGAAVIATACPLCQLNLECYQNQVNQEYGTNFSLPVVYFTQLLGLAFGIPNKRLGIGSELIAATPLAPFAKK